MSYNLEWDNNIKEWFAAFVAFFQGRFTLPFCQPASVCPFPRVLFINIPQADPEATVRCESRGLLIIIYQLSYCYLNARKHIQMITYQLHVSFIYQLCLTGWNPAQFHSRKQTSTKEKKNICRKVALWRLQSLTCFSLVSILAKSPPCFKQNCLASCHDRREMASEKGK